MRGSQPYRNWGKSVLDRGRWDKGGFKELKENYSPAEEL